ncbi:anti-sigma factor [Streptomyces sp. V4-01]|uniref:Regulator of SigK n=1 Tax=Actinacidiphila polyblastidii TaxID=3110430 RepID=A0ABU7PKP0_9ACTN|nr:anti-sigma factor [Streptomyces sp. V4-01]
MTVDDLHTLTGAYALDALSGPESGEFVRHMARCRACAQEVRELRETAARLALAVAEAPPARMRVRVLAALPEVRQLPPLTSEGADGTLPFGTAGPAEGADGPAQPASGTAPRRSPGAGPSAAGGRPAGPPVPGVIPLPAPRRHRYRLPALVAAACLAAAVAAGVAVDARHQADLAQGRAARAEQQATAVAAVASAPDATFHTRALTGGGTATVVASARLGKAAVLYHDLPRLPDARVYQLWFSHDGTMVPAGLVAPGSTAGSGSGSVLLAGTTAGADAVGVTAEPHGGSPAPTGAPLALLPL